MCSKDGNKTQKLSAINRKAYQLDSAKGNEHKLVNALRIVKLSRIGNQMSDKTDAIEVEQNFLFSKEEIEKNLSEC